MAAIALAESGGNPAATNTNTNGTVDRGLWQINSSHGYGTSSFNPLRNAHQAVSVYNTQGLSAWSTYTSGAYRSHLMASGGGSNLSALYNPQSGKITQVDQGVDIVSPEPFRAIGPGRIVHIDPNFYNGTPAVYEKLDTPITVNGRTYNGVYYSETQALVHVGQKVSAGQAVTAAGVGEFGFAHQFGKQPSSWLPAAHGTYDGQHPTQAGQDFANLLGSQPPTPVGGKGGAPPGSSPQPSSGGAGVLGPGSTIGGAAHSVASPFEAVAGVASNLTSASFWIRALEIVGGGLLVLLGLYLLASKAGLGVAASAPVRAAAADVPEGPTRSQLPESEGGPRVSRKRDVYYLDTAPRERTAVSDPATNEIPF